MGKSIVGKSMNAVRSFLLLLALFVFAAAGHAGAQDYPARAVTYVVLILTQAPAVTAL
jgi:hypothetical protein